MDYVEYILDNLIFVMPESCIHIYLLTQVKSLLLSYNISKFLTEISYNSFSNLGSILIKVFIKFKSNLILRKQQQAMVSQIPIFSSNMDDLLICLSPNTRSMMPEAT